MLCLQRQGPAGDLGSHEGVAVPIAAHPGAEPHERRHRRGYGSAGLADQRVLRGAVQPRDRPDQGLVEHRHDRADLVEWFRLGRAQHRGEVQQFDLLEQAAMGGVLFLRSQARVLQALQLLGDAAQARGDRAAPGLGGVGGEDRVDTQTVQSFLHTLRARNRRPQIVAGVGMGRRRRCVQQSHAVAFVGEVHQMQVHSEGACESHGVLRVGHGWKGCGLVQTCDLFGHPLQPRLAQNLFMHVGQQTQFSREFAVHGHESGSPCTCAH